MAAASPQPPTPPAPSVPRSADLCGLAAVLAVFTHGGLGIGGPGGYASARLPAVPERFEPLAVVAKGLGDVLGSVAPLLLLVVGAVCFVRLVAARTGRRWVAGAAGALYAVHPVWGDALVWSDALAPLLALVFLFVAHHQVWTAHAARRPPWVGGVAFAFAGLVWAPAWLYGLVLAYEGIGRRPKTAALLAAASLALCTVAGVFGAGRPGDPRDVLQIAAALDAVQVAARHVLVPWNLTVDAGPDAHGAWFAAAPWIGIAVLGGLLVCAFAFRRRASWAALASAVAAVGCVAALRVLPASEPILAHHRLGLVVAAFALVLPVALQRFAFWRTPIVGAVVLGLAVLSAWGARHLDAPSSMWAHAHAQDPARPRPALAMARLALTTSPAAPEVRKYSELDPAWANTPYAARARLIECEALLRDGNHQGLLEIAAEALSLHKSAREDSYRFPGGLRASWAQAYRYHGEALLRVSGRRAALEALRRAYRLNDRDIDVLVRLGQELAATGNEDHLGEAVDVLERAFSTDPQRVDAATALARAHVLGRNPTAAFAVLDRAKRVHGDTPELLFARARAHLSGSRDVRRAQQLLHRIQELDPKRTHEEAARLQAEIHVAVGRRLYELARSGREGGSYEDALDRFDAAKRADPHHWEADVFAGDALVALAKYEQARGRYEVARTRAAHVRWIDGLLARTAILQAGDLLSGKDTEAARREAAALVAEALRGATRLDLGYLPLESELPLLRRVAQDLGDDKRRAQATSILLTARAVLAGQEPAALRELASAFALRSDDKAAPHLIDACLTLRAMLYERAGNLVEARSDYKTLAARRADDPLPRLRLLQIEMRIALAHRKRAMLFPDEKERLDQANQRVLRIAERVIAFVDAYPERVDGQLFAAEAEMHAGQWIEATQRLNVMHEKHPTNAHALRGLAAVFMQHHATSGDPDSLTWAATRVREALSYDPREIRALLDQAQIAAKAQDFAKAIRYAEEAQRFDPVSRGRATRLLATLHLERAKRALEGGQADQAEAAVQAARRADPSGPGSYLWEGKVLMAKATGGAQAARLKEALRVGMRAKELAPFGRDVDEFLAEVHAQLGFVSMLAMEVRRSNPDPRKAPTWSTLSAEDQAKQLKRYEALKKRHAALREAYRAQALEHYDQALSLHPTGPQADKTKRRIAQLRASDPGARRQRIQDAQAAYELGQKLQHEGESLKALRSYQEAVALNPRHVRAHFWLLRTAYQNLVGIRMDEPSEKEFADRTLSAALRSLHALDALDAESQFAERWYWRGQINRWMYRSLDSPPSRHAARAAYKRFLTLKAEQGETDSPRVQRARTHLEALTRRGD